VQYHSDLFQIETSLLYDGKDGHVLIHVPMTPKNSLLRLFRLHPFPLPLFDTHHLLPDVKNDILAISSTDTRYNAQLSSTDLLSCHRVNQIFMCDSFGVMSRNFNNSCLGALYMQQFEAAQNLCPFKVVPVEEQVYQLRKGHFIAYLPTFTTVNIQCRNGTATEMHLKKGTQQLHISPGCQGSFPNHLVTSDYSVRLDANIMHFEWDWDPINFLPHGEFEEMAGVLNKIGELKLHQPNLADLQYLTQLDSVRSSSVTGSILAGTASSMSGMAFNVAGAAFIVSVVVIFGCICFCSCRRRCSPSPRTPRRGSYAPPPIISNPRTNAEARLGTGTPHRSPQSVRRSFPWWRSNAPPDVTASYCAADEEVQLRSVEDIYPDLPDNQVLGPPPVYATLPRAARRPTPTELQRRLSTLSSD
jgi:hypothetical protein